MKKLLIGLSFLLFAAAANAQTTFCIDYVNFCDGMEFQAGDGLSATWVNTDCAGATSPQDTVIPQGARIITLCQADGVCDLAAQVGFDTLLWVFLLGNGTGTLVGIDAGTPFPFQINTPIAVSAGACAFGPVGQGPAAPSVAR